MCRLCRDPGASTYATPFLPVAGYGLRAVGSPAFERRWSYSGSVIDPDTGSLVLPGGRIDRDISPLALLASPLGADARREDLPAGWTHVYFGSGDPDGNAFGVALHFDGDRLYGYSVSLADPRYGTSWDDYTEEKQFAKRNAHDAWLIASLGEGTREPSPRGPELRYALPWGDVWSTFDARGGSTSIGVRFRREEPGQGR